MFAEEEDPLEDTYLRVTARLITEEIEARYIRSLDDLSGWERQAYEEAIRKDSHVTDSRPGYSILFVERDGTYYRIDGYEITLHDGNESYVLKRMESYSDVDTILDSLVGLTMVPIREDFFPETLEVFETAVCDGQYRAEPMTEVDCKALDRTSNVGDMLVVECWTGDYWYEGECYHLFWSTRNSGRCSNRTCMWERTPIEFGTYSTRRGKSLPECVGTPNNE